MNESDNVKIEGGRIDYLKFSVPLPVEHVKAWKDVWLAVFDADHIAEGKPHTATVGSVKRAENGNYLYAFEAWGEVCANVVELPFDQWAPWLYRIDIRKDCDVTQQGLDTLYSHLRETCGDNRNVQQFNTKPRSKRGGRNAGGIGLQVGSHKSDFRVVVYRRHGEQGAIEVNLTGDVLKDIKDAARMMRKSTEPKWQEQPWRSLMIACDMRGQRKLDLATGLPYQELHDMAEGMMAIPMTEEQRLAEVDALLDGCTLTGLHSVYEALQLRLFSHEH